MASKEKPKNIKKKGHYIPSRYKQAAEQVSVLSNPSKERTNLLKTIRDGQRFQISGNLSQDSSNSSKCGTSHDNREMTSTPTSKGEQPLLVLDASAVTGAESCSTVPHVKERIGPMTETFLTVDFVKRNRQKKIRSQEETIHVPITALRKDKKKNDCYNDKLSEAELDLSYAIYLQAAFLEIEAKKSLESRSSIAKETLYKLTSLVLEDLHKLKSLKSFVKILSTLIDIHEHCQKQEDILKPVFQVIPAVEEQYKKLAEAISATKHKLHVKDVVLPDSGSEGEIIEIIQKITEFIAAFFDSLPEPSYEGIVSMSDFLQKYSDAGELITDGLQRGLNLLMETTELAVSEASLSCGFEKI